MIFALEGPANGDLGTRLVVLCTDLNELKAARRNRGNSTHGPQDR